LLAQSAPEIQLAYARNYIRTAAIRRRALGLTQRCTWLRRWFGS